MNFLEVNQLIEKSKLDVSLKDKKIILPIGETGAGKTTLLLFLQGKKLRFDRSGTIVVEKIANSDIGRIGTLKGSETLTLHAVPMKNHPDKVLVDIPGINDTRGPSIELANYALIHRVIQECSSVIPIIMIDHRLVVASKGTQFRNLLEYVYDLFNGDQNLMQVISRCLFFFTHCPKALNMQTLLKQLNQLANSKDITNHNRSRQMLQLIIDLITDRQWNQIQLFHPINGKTAGLVSSIAFCEGIETPNVFIQPALPKRLLNDVKLQLKDIHLSIYNLLKNENFKSLEQYFSLFTSLGDTFDVFSDALNQCSTAITNLLLDEYEPVKNYLNDVMKPGNSVNDAFLGKIDQYAKLFKNLQPLSRYIECLPGIQSEFSQTVNERATGLLMYLENTPNMTNKELVFRQIQSLEANKVAFVDIQALLEQGNKVLQKLFERFSHQAKEFDFTTFITSENIDPIPMLDELYNYLEEVKSFISIFCSSETQSQMLDGILQTLTSSYHQFSSDIEITAKPSESEKLHLQRCVTVIKAIHDDQRMESIFNSSAKSVWQKFFDSAVAIASEAVINKERETCQLISELHPDLYSEMKVLQNVGTQEAAEQADNLLERLANTMISLRPDFSEMLPILFKLRDFQWLDRFSGWNRIEDRISKAHSSILNEIRQNVSRIKFLFKKKKYQDIVEILTDMHELAPLHGDDRFMKAHDTCYETARELLEELLENLRDTSKKEDIFWRIDAIMKHIESLEALCVEIGLDDERNTTMFQIKSNVDQRIRSLHSKISANVNEFEEQSIILHQLAEISRIPYFEQNSILKEGKNRVYLQIEELIESCEQAIYEENPVAAQESMKELQKARILSEYFPDITRVIRNVNVCIISKTSDVIARIPQLIEEGQIEDALDSIKSIPETSKKKLVERKILSLAQVKVKELEEKLSRFVLIYHDQYINEPELSSIVESIRYLQEFVSQLRNVTNSGSTITPRVTECLRKLDDTLSICTNNALTKYKLSVDFSDRVFNIIDSTSRRLNNLSKTKSALANYTRQTENFFETLSLDELILNFSSIFQLYNMLSKSQNPKYHQILNTLEANIRTKWDEFFKKIVAKPVPESQEQIRSMKSQLLYLPPTLKEFVCYHIEAYDRQIETLSQDIEHQWKLSLEDGNTSRLKSIYKRAVDQESPLVTQFGHDLRETQKQCSSDLHSSVQKSDIPSIVSKLECYRNFVDNFGTEYFPNLSELSGTKQLQSTVSSLIKDINRRWGTKNFDSSFFLQMKRLLNLSQIPAIVPEEELFGVLKPIQEILREAGDIFQRGSKQVDCKMLGDALDLCFKFNPLIMDLQSTLSEKQFRSLQNDLQKCEDYERMKGKVIKLLGSLEDYFSKLWNDCKFATIELPLKNLLKPNLEDLKRHIPDVLRYRAPPIKRLQQLFRETVDACETALQSLDMPEFNKYFTQLDKMKEIATLLEENGLQKIYDALLKQIAELQTQTESIQDFEVIAKTLIDLKQISDDVPLMIHKVHIAIEEILKVQTSANILAIGENLSNGERIAVEISDTFPQFAATKRKIWKQKTSRQDINFALDHFKISTETKSKQSWFWSAIKIFDEPIRIKLLKKYNIFETRFKSVRAKIGAQFSPKQIEKETRRCCHNLANNDAYILANIMAVWSLHRSSFGKDASSDSWVVPHPVQVLTLLRLMEFDRYRNAVNQLIEVPTGEGKSVILGVLATVFALLGYDISCICYSRYLSERDYNDFKEVFQSFGVDDHIEYSTISDMCGKLIDSQGCVRSLTKEFVTTGHVAPSQSNNKSVNRKRALLIDEVDVFFGDDFFGKTYNPISLLSDDETFNMMQYVWRNHENESVQHALESEEFELLLKKYPTWDKLLRGAVHQMFRDVEEFMEHNPTVHNGKIGYPEHGEISTSTHYGYQTAFAYFHFHELGQITDSTLKSSIGISIHCGSFSYAEIPHLFDLIMGVSGTLQTLTKAETKVIESYQINKIAIAPSMYGASQRKWEPDRDIAIIEDHEQWFLRIMQNLQRKTDDDHAVLLFFDSKQVLQKFEDENRKNLTDYQILHEETEHKENIINKAASHGRVTLCSRAFARGSDFICRCATTRNKGGVHLICTYLPESEAELTQTLGRTARQGDPGSVEMILYENDLLQQFSVTSSQLQDVKAGGLGDLLKNAMIDSYTKKVEGLITRAEEVKEIHDKTHKFHQQLINYQTGNKEKLQDTILSLNHSTVASTWYHLYFALDDSGSMSGQPWIDLIAAVDGCLQKRIELCEANGASSKDVVTIINHNSRAKVMCRRESIYSHPEKKTKFKSGGNSFSRALNAVSEEIERNRDDGFTPVLLFMSDGGCGDGETEIIQLSKDYASLGLKIFVIGFSDGCDQKKLQNMADISGGTYSYGADGNALLSEFESISVKMSAPAILK